MKVSGPKSEQVFVPNADNTRQLRNAFGQFATGVTIVTAQSDQGLIGITANSFSSVSLDPAMVLWCPDKASKRYAAFVVAKHFAIHVLTSDQSELCWKIARDGFALDQMGLDTNAEGVPVLAGCLARFECRQSKIYDAGDHAIILGEVLRASTTEDGTPLIFYGSAERELST